MDCQYYILDVFTEARFAGNQLAVVRDCDALSAQQMQAVAREFNFSETAFVLAPRDPVNTARVRIFTPTAELSFAGHPTIGVAILIAQTDGADMLGDRDLQIALELGIGLVPCSVRRPRGRATRAVFEAPQPPQAIGSVAAGDAARALGLSSTDIGFAAHVPTVYSAGSPFAFVPVASQDALSRAAPRLDAWDRLVGPLGCIGAFVYCEHAGSETAHVRARMFAPNYGVPEDPATGSAAAAFAGVCLAYEQPGEGDHEIIIEQGVEMGRRSEIALTMTVHDGALASVRVGGSAIVFASGILSL